MARLLDRTEMGKELRNTECIDWGDGTAMPDDLVQKPGYLGRHLVQTLVDENDIYGDLRLPRLGRDQETANQIFGLADLVIHNGADVSHLKTYPSLRQANLVSPQELVKICLTRNLPLHYISTAGVSMYTSSANMAEVSVRGSLPPEDGHNGYVASEWASEVFLENVHREHGLPICIHRPSSIIRAQSSLEGHHPAADVIQNMPVCSRRILAVQAVILQYDGTLDFVYPETASQKVIKAVMQSAKEHGAGRMTYTHETGDIE
ncbi:hypothetical protein E4U53_003374 [Claviceps sorghi]|nr:hypothetical protein E4U53_003374 [Claviceps sorghi]